MDAIELYKKYFPQARPSLFQVDYIETNVIDLKAWNEALTFWAANDYRAQSIFKMVEYYKEQAKATAWMHVGAHTNEAPENHKCGKCFDMGYLLTWPDPAKQLEYVKEPCECVRRDRPPETPQDGNYTN